MQDGLFDEMELFPFVDEKGDKKPSFKCPGGTGYDRYITYIDDELNVETPIAFGLHPNAEINFRTQQSEKLFLTIMELQPHEEGDGGEAESPQDVAYNVLVDVVDRFQDKYYDLEEIANLVDEIGPYQNVFLQECDAFNKLIAEIMRSLNELSLGFAGELTMSEPMDQLMQSLYLDRVPPSWTKLAWPSQRLLGGWLANVTDRLTQIDDWTQNPIEIPRVTWLPGFVSPQSFLTAIMQVTAQSNQWELDKLAIATEVTKNSLEDCESHSRDGAYIHGFSLQGARWNSDKNTVDKAKPKEMFCPMPVVNCKAINVDKKEKVGIYECPVYKTEQRGPTYVFNAQLKTKSPAARWVMAGVALIMDVAAA
jgi:dynein heavy chain